MPSEFESLMAGVLPGTHFQVFGLAATYTAPDGTETSLTVRVQRHDPRQVDRPSTASGEEQTADVMCMQADLAKPVRGGRFTVEDTEVWTIETTPALRNGEHICTCRRTGVSGAMPRRAKE